MPRVSADRSVALSEVITLHDNTVEAHLRRLCDTGRPGARLPSVRDLQREFRVSPITVQRAVRSLVMEGRAIARPGDGTFIAKPATAFSESLDHSWQTAVLGRAPQVQSGLDHLASAPTASTIALDNSFPDSGLQAHHLLTAAAIRSARRPESWDRCSPQGLPQLRAVFARELGDQFSADDVLVTPGTQAALDSIFRVLARPGDPVVLEDPCYPGAIIAARLSGLKPTPVATDEFGIVPDSLADVLAISGARLVVLQPRHSNPTGSVLSPERRTAVLAIAREFGCFIVEDDWVRDLDLDGPTGPPLIVDDPHGHVISLRSLSKSLAPGLRVAAVIARGPALARLTSARLAADFFVAPMMQATACEVLTSPGWHRHVGQLRTTLGQRRDLLCNTLLERAPSLQLRAPSGGVALWVKLPPAMSDSALAAECDRRGVRISPGSIYALTERSEPHVRIAFARSDPAMLVTAAERIADAIVAVER
jgi:DNA-binding transcriptional MocR family regulator